jgi:hypothetical protein
MTSRTVEYLNFLESKLARLDNAKIPSLEKKKIKAEIKKEINDYTKAHESELLKGNCSLPNPMPPYDDLEKRKFVNPNNGVLTEQMFP